jgi:hypothetical protein
VFDEIIDSIYVYIQIEPIKRLRDICYLKIPIVVINTGNYALRNKQRNRQQRDKIIEYIFHGSGLNRH